MLNSHFLSDTSHFHCYLISTGLYWIPGNLVAGVQYAASDARATWTVAGETCQQDDAQLAVIDSTQKDEFLRELCPDSSQTYVNVIVVTSCMFECECNRLCSLTA